MRNHDPHPDASTSRRRARHRAVAGTPTPQDAAADGTERHWPESIHRVLRLCVVIAVGAILTGVGITVTNRLHPTASSETGAASPTTAPAAPPAVSFTDPPWTVPLPTVPPSPTPRPAKGTAKAKAERTTTTPARRTSPRPTRTATRLAAPVRTPSLLGPPADETLEAVLTTYCVKVRGELAVATLDADADGWQCRHAERTTTLNIDAACRWFYGEGAWSKALDESNPYSWRCYRK